MASSSSNRMQQNASVAHASNQVLSESQGFQTNTHRPFWFLITNSADFIRQELEPARQQYRRQQAALSRVDMSIVRYVGNNDVDGRRIDDEFEDQLRTLIYRYVSQTRHPFPIKFFIDLT